MLVFFSIHKYSSYIDLEIFHIETFKFDRSSGTSFNTGILLFVGVIHIRHKY